MLLFPGMEISVQLARAISREHRGSNIATRPPSQAAGEGAPSLLRVATSLRDIVDADGEDDFPCDGTEEGTFAKEHYQGLSFRHKVYYFLSQPDIGCGARVFSFGILLLILLSSVAFIISTMPEYRDPNSGLPASARFNMDNLVIL